MVPNRQPSDFSLGWHSYTIHSHQVSIRTTRMQVSHAVTQELRIGPSLPFDDATTSDYRCFWYESMLDLNGSNQMHSARVIEILTDLITQLPPLDQLPYTPEFDNAHSQLEERLRHSYSKSDAWRAMLYVRKSGRGRARFRKPFRRIEA